MHFRSQSLPVLSNRVLLNQIIKKNHLMSMVKLDMVEHYWG